MTMIGIFVAYLMTYCGAPYVASEAEQGEYVISKYDNDRLLACWVSADRPRHCDNETVTWHNHFGDQFVANRVQIVPVDQVEKAFADKCMR